MTAPPEILLHRRYPTPVEDVWAAFTESERLARWIGHYSGRGRPGGTVAFTLTGEADAGGEVAAPVVVTIHECAAPSRLVVEIPENADRSWLVEVALAPDGDATAVTFTQRVVEGIDPKDVAAGWSWYLDRLGAALRGAPMPDWSDYTTP